MVTQATCANGEVTAPAITLPETPGVGYEMEPSDLGDGTDDVDVTVTATVEDEYGWGTVTDPWRRVNDTTAAPALTLTGTSCEERVPAAPAVVQAVCAGGAVSAPTLMLAETDDISYSADPAGPYAVGEPGDGGGDAGRDRGRVAGSAAERVGADLAEHGDVSGEVRRRVVHLHRTGGPDGEAGDVYQR